MYTRLKGRLTRFRVHKEVERTREGRGAKVSRLCIAYSSTNYLENRIALPPYCIKYKRDQKNEIAKAFRKCH